MKPVLIALFTVTLAACGLDLGAGAVVITPLETIKVLRGGTASVTLQALSRDGFPVTFSLQDAPPFARVASHLDDQLVLEPHREEGDFTFFVVAHAGAEFARQRVSVRVVPSESGPNMRRMIPSPGADGSQCYEDLPADAPAMPCAEPFVVFEWVDTGHDPARIELEAAAEGDEFTRTPTVSVAFDPAYDPWSLSGLHCIHVPGLVSGQSYRFSARIIQDEWNPAPDWTHAWWREPSCETWIAP